MSVNPGSQDNSLVKEPIQIDFGIPTALNTDTIGTNPLNTLGSFTPFSRNVIKDLRYLVDAGAGLNYVVQTRRGQDIKKTLGFGGEFFRANNLPPSALRGPGMLLNTGQFQWIEQQLLGALTAQSYIVTLQAPLNL